MTVHNADANCAAGGATDSATAGGAADSAAAGGAADSAAARDGINIVYPVEDKSLSLSSPLGAV